MLRMHRSVSPLLGSACLALTLLTTSASAAPSDPPPTAVFVLDLGPLFLPGAGIAMSAFGPQAGEPIRHARLDVTFTTGAGTLASELSVVVTTLTDGAGHTWAVTGADLGFPAASGTFTGSLETDLLDGVLFNPTPFGFPPVEVSVGSTAGAPHGNVDVLKLSLDLAPRLTADAFTLSLAAGGAQQFTLEAGPSTGGGRWAFLLGSASGTSPGIPVGGTCLPLVFDGYLAYTLANPNGPLTPGSLGLLDGVGSGTAAFALPAGTDPALVGLQLHHAYVVIEPGTLEVLGASNAVVVTLLP